MDTKTQVRVVRNLVKGFARLKDSARLDIPVQSERLPRTPLDKSPVLGYIVT